MKGPEGQNGRKVELIKLSHASFKEYFKSVDMRSDLASTFSLDQESADLSIVRLCLRYIAFDDLKSPAALR